MADFRSQLTKLAKAIDTDEDTPEAAGGWGYTADQLETDAGGYGDPHNDSDTVDGESGWQRLVQLGKRFAGGGNS